jgi:hypothetical protein
VIDGGHNTGSNTNLLVPFAKLLSVERRWIVTGTPTANLLGLSFGRNSAAMSTLYDDALLHALEDQSEEKSDTDEVDADEETIPRQWTLHDRQDLHKLGTMLIDFLSVPQFAADRKTFNDVIDPLMSGVGPTPGAIDVLTQVMQSVMIRHRSVHHLMASSFSAHKPFSISDVERDVTLPPISQETVLLDLDPYALKSYNALLTVIAVNAVDSERVDVDYLFHAKVGLHSSTLSTFTG